MPLSSRYALKSLCSSFCLVVASALVLVGYPLSVRGYSNDAPSLTVIIQDDAPYFLPKRTQIPSGATVTWKNVGPSLIHTILIRSASGNIASGSITPGHSWTYHFAGNEDAVVRTSCEIHSYMFGILIVGSPSAEMIKSVEADLQPSTSATVAVRYREFPMPISDSVPGILNLDEEDSAWFTMGGGGFGNISAPPLNHVGRMTSEGDLVVYDLPTPNAGPSGIVLGQHGVAFVTEFFGNKIARIDTNTKTITEISIPTPNSWPTGIAKDHRGNIWFNETNGNKVAKLTPQNRVVEYPLPTPASRSTGIAVDQNDDIWIAERDANKIACLRHDGSFVEYAVPTPNGKPSGIAVAADNTVWFAEREGNKIGHLASGEISEFPLPNPHSGPFIVLPDREGKIWFSEIFGSRVGHLDPETRMIEEFALPSSDSWPAGIASDSVGNIWYTSQLKNKVGVLVLNQPASNTAKSNSTTAPPQSAGTQPVPIVPSSGAASFRKQQQQ